MKLNTILAAIFLSFTSCGNGKNTAVAGTDRDRISKQVKEVVNTMFKGCEEANVSMVTGVFVDSPDFLYLINGRALSYQELKDGLGPIFKTLSKLIIKTTDEKYSFLDRSTVLYTTNCTLTEYFRDGHVSINNPAAISFIVRKTRGCWKIIYGAESYIKQSDTNEK